MLTNKTIFLRNYLLFFIPTFLIILFAWFFLIDGKLFYCSDSVPLLDFIPPFVHGKQVGDYFIASPFIVYAVWILFLLALFLTPAYLTKKLKAQVLEKQHDKKKK